MKITLTEMLAAFHRSRERIDEVMRQTDRPGHRAALLAEMLRSLWPSSPLYVCLLEATDHPDLCALDANGQFHSEWAEWLRAPLSQRGRPAERKPAKAAKLPQALKLPGYVLAVEGITFQEHRWGVLALAVPKDASPQTLSGVRTLLAVCGGQLAARLHAEAQEQKRQALQKDLEAQGWLANTGELAGPLAHEFNNFLNIVLLHMALLEAEIPEKLRSELAELRRQGAGMTALVKQFQQHRRRQQAVQQRVDLNRLVRETVQAITGPPSEPNRALVIEPPPRSTIEGARPGPPAAVPLHLVLAPDLPPVLGSGADLRRLCTFLLTNAAAAAGPVDGSITVRTESSDNGVLLRFEDTGPPVAAELLPQLFEPTTTGRAGTNSLELAACETLVRRLHGKIRCENRAEGGVVVLVELPSAPQEGTAS